MRPDDRLPGEDAEGIVRDTPELRRDMARLRHANERRRLEEIATAATRERRRALRAARAKALRDLGDDLEADPSYWLVDENGEPVYVNGRRVWLDELGRSEAGRIDYTARKPPTGRPRGRPRGRTIDLERPEDRATLVEVRDGIAGHVTMSRLAGGWPLGRDADARGVTDGALRNAFNRADLDAGEFRRSGRYVPRTVKPGK